MLLLNAVIIDIIVFIQTINGRYLHETLIDERSVKYIY